MGTKGLGSYLFVTSEGNILFNTGMPSSGPMIVESIKKLGFKPEDIKVIINGHAHCDHAGAFAYLKELTGACVAIMREDAQPSRTAVRMTSFTAGTVGVSEHDSKQAGCLAWRHLRCESGFQMRRLESL